jgi:pre-mRNA-splicing factor ATP-dependent RNA helicase DHX38/PRP16
VSLHPASTSRQTNRGLQWLATLGGVFYSLKSKEYSARDKRVTEHELNQRMEIESAMAADAARAKAKEQAEAEKEGRQRKAAAEKGAVVVGGAGSVVRKPAQGTPNGDKSRAGGVVKRPVVKRLGRGF